MSQWESHRRVQSIAKSVLDILGPTITASDSEASITERAASLLADQGATETWYYDCPAFVLLGSRSCESISGKEYKPSTELVGFENLITVDLSPSINGIWGDYARSFVIESGRHVPEPVAPEFRRGLEFELKLHASMKKFVSVETTFEELHQFSNDQIISGGFENLDFLGNLGHSIEAHLGDRVYIEAGSPTRLSDGGLFTFEPHIRELGGNWGFKHENIYYFNEKGRAVEL
ncbi:MAG: Xaa-Pro aminopeptidase [Xanthomonadales bacterium]|nr:Xaa-Pro aminopeptidase [Xanthomonadales bacterium]